VFQSLIVTYNVICRWFRAHTWRGRLKLSCDYNAAMLPREAPHGFLRMVMEMLTEAAR
jgi:hypothetical protein